MAKKISDRFRIEGRISLKVMNGVAKFCCPIVLSFLYTPLLVIGVTDVLGTAKGKEYTIREPELSAYQYFGYVLLLVILFSVVLVEYWIKRRFYRKQTSLFLVNVAMTILGILVLWPLFCS